MARPVTEIAFLSLAAGSNIEDPSSPAGQIWKEFCDTVGAGETCQRIYWGRQVEDPTVLHICIDWDSVEAHIAYTKLPVFPPLSARLRSLVDGKAYLIHVHFEPHPPLAVLSGSFSPVTEILTVYLPSSTSPESQKAYEQNFAKFMKVLEECGEGYRGYRSGWVVEELEHESLGGKGKAYLAAIGWDSVEKHQATREKEKFKENIGLLKSEGVTGLEMHHVKFMP
ncbi:MAG: hypothetical protein Q9187_004119 [Circinaria calcarea]